MGKGSDSNPGTFTLPLATVSKAVSLCNANRADVIMVGAGHAETITAPYAISKAGCTVVGLGNDTNLPTFTMATSATATLSLTGANSSINNCLFIDTIGCTSVVTCAAVGAAVNNCTIRDTSGAMVSAISCVGGGSNLADKSFIAYNTIENTAGGTQGILMHEIDDQVEIIGNQIIGTYSAGLIVTNVAVTNLKVIANNGVNYTSNAPTLVFNASSTGYCCNNNVTGTATATKTLGGMLTAGGNYLVGVLF